MIANSNNIMLIPNPISSTGKYYNGCDNEKHRNNYGLNDCGRINRTVCAIIFFHKYKDKKIKYRFFNLKYFLNRAEL